MKGNTAPCRRDALRAGSAVNEASQFTRTHKSINHTQLSKKAIYTIHKTQTETEMTTT